MLRTRRWKLNYYHGHRPQLFDMARDPRETTDLGDEPGHAAVRDGLMARLLATWDPEAIARRMRRRRLDKDLVGAWCRTMQPPDAYRWQLRMEDNWLGEPPEA
jgi:choline-sulfatase